ncbi:MAG: hypothetical protein ACOVMI_08790 [Chitinophagaceae bacterium]|jgi:hypothetical protein
MKPIKQILYYFIAAMLMASCSSKTTHLTSAIRKQIEAKSLDFKKLQYYVDSDIELTREVKSDTAKITSGKLFFSNGKYINQIILKANTKGVCKHIYPNRLAIAFEEGEDKFLNFGVNGLSAFDGAIYQLLPSNMISENTNKVFYEGNEYTIKIIKQLPRLLIATDEIFKGDTKKRTMKGVTVKDK